MSFSIKKIHIQKYNNKKSVESSRNIYSLWLILLKSALTVFIWK